MDLTAELQKYGPGTSVVSTSAEARAYCRHLAGSHYENFTVVSGLLPRHLHQHFCNVYAYCRWADDLADETHDRSHSLELLDWWEQSLRRATRGEARHPVFVALAQTMGEFELTEEPFLDLLTAFRRDQQQSRYESFEQLLDYCRYSANPVGRIVLKLGRSYNDENVVLSDSICTGLQLANFWQDVRRDFAIGRIYIPLEDLRDFDVAAEELVGPANDRLRHLLRFECNQAANYLQAGEALVGRVSKDLRLPVRLFIDGGLKILQAIQRQKFDVWSSRPTVGKLAKLHLLSKAWFATRFAR